MEASDYLTSDDALPAVPPTPTSVEGWSLKPCPFCGGEAKLWGEDSTWAKLCRVSCTVCYANTGSYVETRAAAAENWNRRPAVLPTTSVEEATRRVGVKLTVGPADSTQVEFRVTGLEGLVVAARDEGYANGVHDSAKNAEIIAVQVRTATLQEVTAMVEGMQGVVPAAHGDGSISLDAPRANCSPTWVVRRADVLAGLANMETP